MKDFAKNSPNQKFVETWVSLPFNRRPKHWDSIDQPVCLLKLNLYGHPLAGLLWEKHCQKAIFRAGFERIPGWECLFVHRAKGLFLSIYVDDFKMAGRKENIKPMWDLLSNKEWGLDLETPVPVYENVYLGNAQQIIDPPIEDSKLKSQMMDSLLIGTKQVFHSTGNRGE